MDFSSLSNMPIIDGHVHFIHPDRLDDMNALLNESGCARANLVCMPNPDATTHNPAALYFKERFPDRVFIAAALEYGPALADLIKAPALLGKQIRTLRSRGFDGLKLIEGKPQVRKLLPHALDGPLYAEMWAALEEEQLPVVLHVADPDEFWDPATCPDWARASGWDYTDGTYPMKEDLYAEVDAILVRHPRLRLQLAHFYFLNLELERAGRFLDAHPSICFDLAPHVGMYQGFSCDPEPTRKFFLRYQDRIIYGTDLDTRPLLRGESGRQFMRFIPWLVRSTLEREGSFTTDDGTKYHGLGLPQEALRKIYISNFERMHDRRQPNARI